MARLPRRRGRGRGARLGAAGRGQRQRLPLHPRNATAGPAETLFPGSTPGRCSEPTSRSAEICALVGASGQAVVVSDEKNVTYTNLYGDVYNEKIQIRATYAVGGAYLYARSGSGWELVQQLTIPGGEPPVLTPAELTACIKPSNSQTNYFLTDECYNRPMTRLEARGLLMVGVSQNPLTLFANYGLRNIDWFSTDEGFTEPYPDAFFQQIRFHRTTTRDDVPAPVVTNASRRFGQKVAINGAYRLRRRHAARRVSVHHHAPHLPARSLGLDARAVDRAGPAHHGDGRGARLGRHRSPRRTGRAAVSRRARAGAQRHSWGFTMQSLTGTEVGGLPISGYGAAVSVLEDRIAVGSGGGRTAHVWRYDRSDSQWKQEASFTDDFASAFGSGISLSKEEGDLLLAIGDPSAGRVFSYALPGRRVGAARKARPRRTARATPGLGRSVALAGDRPHRRGQRRAKRNRGGLLRRRSACNPAASPRATAATTTASRSAGPTAPTSRPATASTAATPPIRSARSRRA